MHAQSGAMSQPVRGDSPRLKTEQSTYMPGPLKRLLVFVYLWSQPPEFLYPSPSSRKTNAGMFRKKQDVAERSRNLLKSSAARRIKADILVALPSLTKDVLDELMPNKVIHVCVLSTRLRWSTSTRGSGSSSQQHGYNTIGSNTYQVP